MQKKYVQWNTYHHHHPLDDDDDDEVCFLVYHHYATDTVVDSENAQMTK